MTGENRDREAGLQDDTTEQKRLKKIAKEKHNRRNTSDQRTNNAPKMREEIAAAVVFLTRLIMKNDKLSRDQVHEFSTNLSVILGEKFKNHWYLEDPTKGQAYRCIRINEAEPVDPVLVQAALTSGLTYKDLRLPTELTLWVDPADVCCRYGVSSLVKLRLSQRGGITFTYANVLHCIAFQMSTRNTFSDDIWAIPCQVNHSKT